MKILTVSQLFYPTPASKNSIFAPGMIAYKIALGLKKRGHEIKMYASADSDVDGLELETLGIKATGEIMKNNEGGATYRFFQHELLVFAAAYKEYLENDYDLMHVHSFANAMHFSKFIDKRIVCTYHGIPNDENDLKFDIDKIRQKQYYQNFDFIAVSKKQIDSGHEYFNFVDCINHGIDISKFTFEPKVGEYLLFVGRIVEGKNPHLAIEAALKVNSKIVLAGDIDYAGEYFEKYLKKYSNNPMVKFLGHVGYEEMNEIYGKAKALIFPITWDEAFGLVMIEAMACGTPVIAFNRGSVSEIIQNGKTGFVVDGENIEGLVSAIGSVDKIDRAACRSLVEEKFTEEIMVDKYEKLFRNIISSTSSI